MMKICENNTILGIDTGIASLGWSILFEDKEEIAAGAWLFDAPEKIQPLTHEQKLSDKRKLKRQGREHEKTPSTAQGPTNRVRREKRSLRRVVFRKAGRMKNIRHLCKEHGLIENADKQIFKTLLADLNRQAANGSKAPPEGKVTPWSLRAKALERSLSGQELAVILGHIAKHAGFKSNRKGGEKNEKSSGEDQKALKAMEGLASSVEQYKTFGKAMFEDKSLNQRKRNRQNIYDRTPKRDWLDKEISLIFQTQRDMGNALAKEALEQEYKEIAFTRLPLQDSEHLLAPCPFEAKEKRTSQYAPSFERFRLLQSLAHMRLDWPSQLRGDNLSPSQLEQVKNRAPCALTQDQIRIIEEDFANTKKLTFKRVRKLLDLPDEVGFQLKKQTDGETKHIKVINSEDEKDQDIAARTKSGAEGTVTLRTVLGEELFAKCTPEQLDETMAYIAFRETAESIRNGSEEEGRKGLKDLGLPDGALEKLMEAVDDNKLSFATGAASLSAKACRNIIPWLRQGLVYSKACTKANYDHTKQSQSPFVSLRSRFGPEDSITQRRKRIIEILADPKKSPVKSPVARKSVIEIVKQFATLCHEQLDGCLPSKVHIELARDIGHSGPERERIDKGIKDRTAERSKTAKHINDTYDKPPKRDNIRRFELAQEQGWRCLYSGRAIDPNLLFDGPDYQVDHILPWSRFGDNSFHNLTLCLASENQRKKNRTPYEWFEKEGRDWKEFVARVQTSPGGQTKKGNNLGLKGMKKRNYLLKNAKEREKAFKERNLNDTKWAAKVALQAIEAFYPIELNEKSNPIRRVFARPGALTAILRQNWGLEALKKDKEGKRHSNDRHHALDAIVVAATGEGMLQNLTKACQKAEMQGQARSFSNIPMPWSGFRKQMEKVVYGENQQEKKVIDAEPGTVRIARPERRRARGEGHAATIRGLDPETNTVFVRETPENIVSGNIVSGPLKKAAGNREALYGLIEEQFEHPERSWPIIEALTDWGIEGMSKDQPPLGPTGDPIRKVRVRVIGKHSRPEVILPRKFYAEQGQKPRQATAGRGKAAMARTDVFYSINKGGKKQYWLVPVYGYQVMNKAQWPEPPNKAIMPHKPEEKWQEMGAEHQFLFSLYSHSWLKVVTAKGEIIEGYFKGADRASNSIEIASHNDLNTSRRGIGARNLSSFRKFAIDRLGNKHEIKREKRTWHDRCV